MKNKTYHKKKILVVFTCAFLILTGLIGRLVYLMVFDAEYYQKRAEDLHKRERKIKAARGEIVDRNGVVLATNKTVCTISVIHSQIKEPERVTEILAKELEMDQAEVRKRVEKISSMEKVKTNVEKEVGDKIREYNLDGVKVDEDYKRYYPYDSLASKVLGFTGGDNQGIIGLEVKYEETLKGSNGTILTTTDARGIELDAVAEGRIEPVAGKTLEISMDYNIQKYCEQAAAPALSFHAILPVLYTADIPTDCPESFQIPQMYHYGAPRESIVIPHRSLPSPEVPLLSAHSPRLIHSLLLFLPERVHQSPHNVHTKR